MKISITFKTPSAVEDALDDIPEGEERDTIEALMKMYVQYGELVTLEFDTRAWSVTVKKCGV